MELAEGPGLHLGFSRAPELKAVGVRAAWEEVEEEEAVAFLERKEKLDKACHRPPCIGEQISLVLHMGKIAHAHVLGDSLK